MKNNLYLHFFIQCCLITLLVFLVRLDEGHRLADKFISTKYIWTLYLSVFILFITILHFLDGILSCQIETLYERSPWYILFLFLAIFPALEADLGSKTVTRRGEQLVLSEANNAIVQLDSIEEENDKVGIEIKTYSDGLNRISDIAMNDQKYLSKTVEITGKVAFYDELPENTFYIFRFIIYCCAADAIPAGLIVTGIGIEGIEEDEWYQIKGKVGLLDVGGVEYLSIEAEKIESIVTPDFPYENL